ncbi:hypothetical protein ACFV0T_37550 [Streptomyces sp. NPDC059582]|uniref:hypothetical protein n=1 Tax=Streptomyces sp. NPDC059582 TaxID=3346875 RepID=UPI00369C88D1
MALQERDARRRASSGDIWLDHRGRLPAIRDLDDPVRLGVHPAVERDARRGVPPAFIVRDFDAQLVQALHRDRFVLLVGESTAGKSRAAYELIRAELPQCQLVVPVRREATRSAVEAMVAKQHRVLWLDDLERFLGTGGLSAAAVRAVLDASHGSGWIVATMRSEEYSTFTGGTLPGADGAARDAQRQGLDALRMAVRIDVPRRWSREEIAEARTRIDDARLVDAVRHADEYGVAEYLAAAPQLLTEWRDAWAPARHPRAAAMVLAAVDARRAGVHRPLPLSVLLRLHEPYLSARGGVRLRPESTDAAISWATTPLHATSSLLIPADDGYLAFDYLIDAVGAERPGPAALDALVAFATPEEALDLGVQAQYWSMLDQAEAAFRKAEGAGLFAGTAHRCWLIRDERGDLAASLRFADEAATRIAAAHGPNHLKAFEAHFLVACETGNSGDAAGAVRLLGDLAVRAERVLGGDHKKTLEIRDAFAEYTGDTGDAAEALRLHETILRDCCRVLGEADGLTISTRERIAFWLRETDQPARAATVLKDLESDMLSRFRTPSWDAWWIGTA